MYVERYRYQPIPRVTVGGRRFYATPDGNRLPSVTTILDATKPQEARQKLNEWRQRVGTERAQQITTEAANRGTRMHSFLERYIRDGNMPTRPTNPFSWSSHAMAETVIDHGLKHVSEFWGVEIPLYFPSIYAGTSDGVGMHRGQESILDYKQTNRPKRREWVGDYFLQLAAYAEAHNAVHGTDIRKGVVLMCVKPGVDQQQNIVSPPQYQEFLIEGGEFEHCRQEWWKRVEEYYRLNM